MNSKTLNDDIFLLSSYDYELPEELIAQSPAERRDMSRLLVMDRSTGELSHKHFCDIIDYLNHVHPGSNGKIYI